MSGYKERYILFGLGKSYSVCKSINENKTSEPVDFSSIRLLGDISSLRARSFSKLSKIVIMTNKIITYGIVLNQKFTFCTCFPREKSRKTCFKLVLCKVHFQFPSEVSQSGDYNIFAYTLMVSVENVDTSHANDRYLKHWNIGRIILILGPGECTIQYISYEVHHCCAL